MSVLVFIDTLEGKVTKSSLEAASYAGKVATDMGQTAVAVTYGSVDSSSLASLGVYGISKVLHDDSVNAVQPARLTSLVAEAQKQEGSEVVIFSQDYTGKTIAPMVSARLKAGLVSGAVDYPSMDAGFVVKKQVFSGKAFAQVAIHTDTKVVAILPNSIGKKEGEGSATVESFSPSLGDDRIQIKSVEAATGGDDIPLTEAELVVSAGRGLKGPENWGMVDDLAKELHAATACSRPVADIGWRPHHEHVGQTGIAIRPNLYIAIGISGAIQHLAGVNGSKVIVVINTDPEAPFFKAADYGIVGDAFEVVPKLTEAIRKLKAAG